MSTSRRAFDLLRAYVNHEVDRLRSSNAMDAWEELEQSLDPTKRMPSAPSNSTPSPSDPYAQAPLEDQIRLSRVILGVSETATFDDIRKAYERLNRRSDPSLFPAGSVEQLEAKELNRKINIAYRKLTEALPTTEKRFRSLEID